MRNTMSFLNINFRIKLFILCFLPVTLTIQAQNTKIDSLKNELALHSKKDTTRVNLLNALAFSYFSSDLEKSIEYLEESGTLANAIHFKKGKARSIYITGITEAIQSNFDQALDYYQEALNLYESIDFKKGVASCYNAMGITYKNKGELKKSIYYYKKAIEIEEKIGSDNLAASFLNLGSSYELLGEFDDAILYLKKALSIAKNDNNDQRVAYSLNNLGVVYQNQGNYPLALEYFKESLYINEKLGDSLGIANHLSNLAKVYQAQKEYDKAMAYYKKSLKIHKSRNRKQGISEVLNDIGLIHKKNGDYENALNSYVEALRISKEIGAKSLIPAILVNIGEVYLTLNEYSLSEQFYTEAKNISLEIEDKRLLCDAYIGIAKTYQKQKKYKLALSTTLEAKKISEETGLLENQRQVSELLSNIYKATGNYKDALDSYETFKILNDSLFNKANVEKITQLEYEYKYKKALDSASIRELKLTKTMKTTSEDLAKTKQNYLWAVIGILVISILSGSFVFYQKYKNVKIINQNIVTEQKLLRSQMTPHFIFNSLSVLQGMILNKEEKKSITYLSKFSKLLRLVLENSRDKIVPLIQELDAIDNYMTLQNLDADPPFDYSLTVDENIDINLFLIPPMLIQPFIENVIEHAFINDQEHCEIKIHLSFKDQKLSCTIIDNGVGIDTRLQRANTKKKSLATTITSERLNLLAKDFSMPGSVVVEDRKKYNAQGTKVTLIIPYKLIENS